MRKKLLFLLLPLLLAPAPVERFLVEEIAAVERYVSQWSSVKVWVEDAEGRHERVVSVAAVESARAWLAKASK